LREEGRRELAAVRDKRERARLEREQGTISQRLGAEAERRKGEIASIAAGDETAPAPPLERAEPGTRVLVRSLGKEGEIVGVRGDRVDVRLGRTVFTVERADLRALAAARRPPASPVSAKPPPSRPVDDLGSAPREILLLGKTVEEGLSELDKFLDDASLSGWTE